MISICIPTYYSVIYNLCVSMVEQCIAAQAPFEIIVIDDASDERIKKFNAPISDISYVSYIELDQNIGRSAIRNLFLKYAKFDYLLFLDCDSELPDNYFISRYFEAIKEKALVVCGGRIYDKKPENKSLLLRWNYGINRECLSAKKRMLKPSDSFLSNNFVIKKDVFEKFRFNENIRQYGHEDTLFGYVLKQNQINIIHIDNPTIHKYSENASEFLVKTRMAVENLYYIDKQFNMRDDFGKTINLIKAFRWIDKLYLVKIFGQLYFLIAPILHFLFIRIKIVNLRLFDLYKLLYLCYFSSFKKETKIC